MTTPCPFCGEPEPIIDEIQPGVFAAVCPACNAIGPHTYDRRHSSVELAARQWDERQVAA